MTLCLLSCLQSLGKKALWSQTDPIRNCQRSPKRQKIAKESNAGQKEGNRGAFYIYLYVFIWQGTFTDPLSLYMHLCFEQQINARSYLRKDFPPRAPLKIFLAFQSFFGLPIFFQLRVRSPSPSPLPPSPFSLTSQTGTTRKVGNSPHLHKNGAIFNRAKGSPWFAKNGLKLIKPVLCKIEIIESFSVLLAAERLWNIARLIKFYGAWKPIGNEHCPIQNIHQEDEP